MWIGVLALVVAAGAFWRARHLRAMNALTMRHRRLGEGGVVIGGEGFTLERAGAPAVLLLHGGGDTPQTLRYLGEELHARGFHVVAPLLPGHGRTLREFARVTADELTAAAASSYATLRASHEWVAVIGLSMGGALAAQIAAGNQSLPALGLVAPYLSMPKPIEWAARLAPAWGIVVPAVRSGDDTSIRDPDERTRGLAYGVFTAAGLIALRETMRRGVAALERISAPTLMMQSREDNRITVADAERTFARIGSREKSLEWVSGAGHIITVDFGRDAVNARLAAFVEAHTRAASRNPTSIRS
ncbi:MAG: alpha/beta hydrolase [Gemmatimonadaceae bacterium]